MDLITFLLYSFTLLLIWQFIGYPIIMALIIIERKPFKKNNYYPHISIITATYNEEKVIGKRIKNLLELDYPSDKYEIIIVDSGSTDKTVAIAEDIKTQYSGNKPIIKILQEGKRNGKASAINFAKSHAEGEILLIADANSIYDRNAIREITPYFEDPKVGAVSGRYTVLNKDETLARSEGFYWEIEQIMFTGESAIDSIPTVIGTISAWRKELVDFSKDTITEDLDMTIRVRRAGYKIKYEPNAITYEPAATSVNDQIKQRRRTSLGTIQCIFKNLDYFLVPRNLFSLLIFPSHKSIVMVSPFILLAIPVLYLLSFNIFTVITHVLISVESFTMMLITLIGLKSNITKKSGKAKFSVISTAYYVLLNEYIILIAWKDFILRKNNVLWEKAESTRCT